MSYTTFAALAVLAAGRAGGSGAGGGRLVKIKDVSLRGEIEGENVGFELGFTASSRGRNAEVALVSGDLVLEEIVEPKGGCELRYDLGKSAYCASWRRAGERRLRVRFACRPKVLDDGEWREAVFAIPASNVRRLDLACDRTDMEVAFPGAMRVEREIKDGRLVVAALLGPDRPFAVRWKPQVQKLEAELVMASEANTIVSAGTGALRIDSVFIFEISQGSLKELIFAVPKALSVTQVRGSFIRDWQMADRTLSVTLTRPQARQYALQVKSEMILEGMPAEVELSPMEPEGAIRASGCIIVGTDSAIRVVVEESSGLGQLEAAAFPRIVLDREHPRPVPRASAYCYSYATSPFRMKLSLDDIVPSFDAVARLVVGVREDDLVVDAEIEIDVRDAPIRKLRVGLEGAFAVSEVAGARVEDYAVKDGERRDLEVQFREPVLGRALVGIRLELGESPLGKKQRIGPLTVRGAKSERGYLVVTAEKGVEFGAPAHERLREVHTGSVPMRVPGAQFAYRFRHGGWSLELSARRKPAGIRAEAFHLISVGEGVVYGSVVVTYFVSGAPVDELRFRIPPALQNVEFVGSDVRRWSRDGENWSVELQRKVIGDYTLLVTYNQHYRAGGTVLVGGVECDALDTQTGYVAVASHLSIDLAREGEPGADILEVDPDEVPSAYRLLVNSPVLKAYKYVNAPHRVSLGLAPHARGRLLPAVVDMTEIETEVSMRKGEAESVTRVRYRVKNSASQFLALVMPPGAHLWTAHIIERDAGGAELRARAAASYDGEKGTLMIPLPRRRDPNDPVTVELEYAQAHGELGRGGAMEFAAPRGSIRSTFARWELKVPAGRAVYPEGGDSMSPEERAPEERGLAALATRVLRSRRWQMERLWSFRGTVWLCLVGAAGAGVVFFLRRSALPDVALAALLLAALFAGVGAACSPFLRNGTGARADLSAVAFTQVLDLPLSISVRALPAWRRHATLFGSVAVPLVGLLLLAAAAFARRARNALIALGATGILYGAAQFPALWPLLGHILTWGVPLLLTLAFAGRFLVRLSGRARSAPAAALLLLAAFAAEGCSRGGHLVPPPGSATPILGRVDCSLAAEKDSMAVELLLRVDAPGPVSFPVMPRSAILLEPAKESRDFGVVERGGNYCVVVKRRGEHELRLKFLAPLAKAGEDRLRRFRLAIPPALANRVTLEVPEAGMEIEAPTAVRLTAEEADASTVAHAIFGLRDEAAFVWKPRAREPRLEKTVFFAEVTGLVRFDVGLAECRYRLLCQVAQGELSAIRVRIPEGMTVTGVIGEDLGAWRFDPSARELEARLSRSASGEYELLVSTQASAGGLPYAVTIGTPELLQADRQRGSVGLAASPAVFIEVEKHPAAMNAGDFVRDAAALIARAPGVSPNDVRHAYRCHRLDEVLAIKVGEVTPEIRASETASFTVADDRLVYNGEIALVVGKAGVFSAELALPEGYDVDALGGPEVSHWDEGAGRAVRVHFRRKLLGAAALKLALSRTPGELPRALSVPRVGVRGALKHTGRVVVSSDRGVRLSVAERSGVSELSPVELGIRAQGVLAFKLLKPEWSLKLRTEIVETRSVVEFLHLARVTDGLVRETARFSFRLHNAGTKLFRVQVPEGALGLEIDGPEIAHLEEAPPESGLWRIELSRKWFGRPYPLTVRYETRFDRASGEVRIPPVKAAGVDLQRGHVVVFAGPRMELTPVTVGSSLRWADARNVPRRFGAGDLSAAAFCCASSAPDYELVFRAARHEAASLLDAEVRRVTVSTVATEAGESVNRVEMELTVGSRRYLEMLLPPGAELWSLLVQGRSVAPSKRGGEPLLVPLGRASPGEVPVSVEFVYAVPAPGGGESGRRRFAGPRFDLPLRNVTWVLYLPEACAYDEFDGTLVPDGDSLRRPVVRRYGAGVYEAELRRLRAEGQRRAQELLKQGGILARKGEQRRAKKAFESALSFSLSREDLSEDARVQLHRLSRQQAVVGLVGRRGRVRPRFAAALEGEARPGEGDLGEEFSPAQAERLQSSLSKADGENLQLIADRMVQQQEEASDLIWPLWIGLATRGRMVRFTRSLQVEPNSEMAVSFAAAPADGERDASLRWAAGLFALSWLGLACGRLLASGKAAARRALFLRHPAARGARGAR